MGPLKKRSVEGCLVNKLECKEQSGKHWFYDLYDGTEIVAWTMISHGGSEIPPNLVGKMARQLKVSTPTFVGAVACHVSREDFMTEVRQNLSR